MLRVSACLFMVAIALLGGHARGELDASTVVRGPSAGPKLPISEAPESCPQLQEGVVRVKGVDVEILAAGPARTPGPLIMYWHGTDGDARLDLRRALGVEAMNEIRATGGLVAAPVSTTSIGRDTSGIGVWHEGDFDVLDEIVECASAEKRLDPMRIHAMGMSAGGLHTASLGYARSQYIASVVTFSGGHLAFAGLDSMNQVPARPDNRFAALILHGGHEDQYGLRFEETSAAYAHRLRQLGHRPIVCNHRQGHRLPELQGYPAWRFLKEHPFGVETAYPTRLPEPFAGLCTG